MNYTRNESEGKYLVYTQPRPQTIKRRIKKLLYSIKAMGYRLCMRFYHPKGSEKKYYTSICAIFKNEAKYFKEWIEFHKIIGVEHFYLYNNFSTDNYLEVLKPYIDSGLVEVFDWPVPQGQMSAYADCIKRSKEESQWVGFIDLDEFIVPNHYDSIKDFLMGFQRKHRPAVKIYWRLFGTSGHIARDTNNLVTEDFHCCWPKYYEVGKCFWNTDYELEPDYSRNHIIHHFMWPKYGNLHYPPVDVCGNICVSLDSELLHTDDLPVQINHYFTKSYQEYSLKKQRGDVYFKVSPVTDEYFFRHEMRCQSVDYRIYKYMVLLKNNLDIKN